MTLGDDVTPFPDEDLYLGRFQLIRQLGKGGMGEVWLAQDPKLGRRVAIKMLPPGKATDNARQRFQREIRSLAACSHPVIARIYEAGEADWPVAPHQQVAFIVMELVVGETLKERIRRGPLTLAETLSVTCRALEGLAVAHDNHLVHRDIKPANLMLTEEGEVKLLDLGLARLAQTEATRGEIGRPIELDGDDPGLETTLTAHGDLIGTPAYMSPEQVKSRPIDARADIWAVGQLLLEMLTGQRAIRAGSSAEALAEIPGFELDRELLPKGAPPHLMKILERCISQDLRNRYHHARDLLYDLDQLRHGRSKAVGHGWLSPRAISLGLGSLLVIALAVLAAVYPRTVTQPVYGAVDLGFDGYSPVISPDGTRVFYVGEDGREIRVASTSATGNHQLVLASERTINNLAISPDGTWIFYDQLDEGRASQVFRVPASGGTPRRVTSGWAPSVSGSGELVACFDWTESRQWGLWICHVDGGDRRMVKVLQGSLEPLSSCFTEGNRQVLVSRTEFIKRSEVLRIDLESGRAESTVVVHGIASPGLSPIPGKAAIVWGAQEDSLRFLNVSLAVSRIDIGTSTPLSLGVAYHEYPSIAADGKLALLRAIGVQETWIGEVSVNPVLKVPGSRIESRFSGALPRVSPDRKSIVYVSELLDLMIRDREAGTLRYLTTFGRNATNPSWSPDGRKLAYMSIRDGEADIWIASIDGSSPCKVTDGPANDFQPSWHPDGVHLVWISDRDGIERLYRISTASGEIERLSDEAVANPDISPDGKYIAFVAQSRVGRSLRLHHLTEQLQLGALIWRYDGRVKPWAGYRPRFSPDGQWLGFEAPVEPAGGDIFAVPLNDPGGEPPIRLTRLQSPSDTSAWWDWIDSNRLVVSYSPIQARLLLLRDADHWFERALVGEPDQ